MGATGSRSSPPTKTVLVGIEEYSKLMRTPARRSAPILDTIRLDNLRWEVTVTPMDLNKATGVSDSLIVEMFLGIEHSPESALGIDMSIEILDHTGLYTVFHHESSTTRADRGNLLLAVWRSELEASSCIRGDDSFHVRCTVKERRRPSLLGKYCFSSKSEVLPKVATMSDSQTITVDSLSKLKAALLPTECAHSRRFAAGASRWYFTLNPTLAAVRLIRVTKEDDDTRISAQFSFALEGAVNLFSGVMTQTFDRDNPDFVFEYQPPEELSTSSADRLVVWCCVKVIPAAVVPTAAIPSPPVTIPPAVIIPAAGIPTNVPPAGESVLTPLLSAMHN